MASAENVVEKELYNSLISHNNELLLNLINDIIDLSKTVKKVEEAYRDEERWAKMALLNTACSGKFTSDRTIQQYVDEIWHLDKVVIGK